MEVQTKDMIVYGLLGFIIWKLYNEDCGCGVGGGYSAPGCTVDNGVPPWLSTPYGNLQPFLYQSE